MTKLIFCVFLQKKSEQQDFQVYPGAIGNKIYENISKAAWKIWLQKQTILINENRLDLTSSKDREFIHCKMVEFLFNKNN